MISDDFLPANGLILLFVANERNVARRFTAELFLACDVPSVPTELPATMLAVFGRNTCWFRWCACACGRSLDEFVDQVLEEFLAAARVGLDVSLLQHIVFEFLEAGLAFLDFFANAGMPGAVALSDEFGQAAIAPDRGGDFESAREGVHAGDVRVEQI